LKEIETLLHLFDSSKDLERADKMSQYMKNRFSFYGISSVPRREIQKEWYKIIELNSSEQLLAIVRELWQQDYRECQYVALDLLEKHKKKLLNETHIPFLEQLIIEKSWWDTVDLNAANIIGHILRENHSLLVKKINEWMNSDNNWLKRTAILAQLKYKLATDFELLKKVSLHLKDEPDFFIRKSIGWAFREYAKVNFEAVETLVLANNFSALTKKEALKNKS